MCISNLPTKFSEWKASCSLISDCFLCVFFLTQLENSLARDCFFSVFITSPYFLKLLPICTGERSHFFSLNLRASLVLQIIGTSSAFVKKAYRIVSLMVICGPQKFQMAPPKKSEGGQTWPSKLLTWGQRSYTEPSRKDVLPSKI